MILSSSLGITRAFGLTTSCSLLPTRTSPLTDAGYSHSPSCPSLKHSCPSWGAHPPLLSSLPKRPLRELRTLSFTQSLKLYTKTSKVCGSRVHARSPHSGWGCPWRLTPSGKWQSTSSIHWPPELWVVASVSRHLMLSPRVSAWGWVGRVDRDLKTSSSLENQT